MNITAFYEDFTVAWDWATQNGHHNLKFLEGGDKKVPVAKYDCGKNKFYDCFNDHRCHFDSSRGSRKCHPLRNFDAEVYSYRKGFKKVEYIWDRGIDFIKDWKNGIDTSKYDYEVKEHTIVDPGNKIKLDKHVKAGQSTYYDWMKKPKDWVPYAWLKDPKYVMMQDRKFDYKKHKY